MKKRLASILLVLCLVLSVMPANAFAATEYGLYINDFQFTSSSLTYTGESGSGSYDPGTKVLTLKNLTVSTGDYNTIIYSEIDGLTVKVDGKTTINLKDNTGSGGIATDQTNMAFALNGNTTIVGANGDKAKDQIIINSKSVGVTTPEADGTTRVGIAVSSTGKVTIRNITLSMTDNSSDSYLGHASLIRAQGAVTVENAKLEAKKCQLGLYMIGASAVLRNTELAMALTGSTTSGLNFDKNTDNRVENCTGTVEAEYPLYTYGKTTVTGSEKLTLRSSNIAVVAKKSSDSLGGQVIFDNANVEIHSTGKGIQAENLGKVTVKNGGNIQVNAATNGLRVFENGTFTLESGTVTLTGTGAENSYGLYADGTAEIKGGTLNTGNVYAAILNAKTKTVSFTGGTHNLKGLRIGYIDNAAGQLTIGGSANVTFEAPVGIQLSEKKGGKLNLTGGELSINCTTTGLNSLSGAGKTTLSGGKLKITDKNESPSAVGIYARGEMEVCGAELSFTGCKTDIQSINGANKLSSGKISLSGASCGMQIYLGFLMTGGQIDSQCATAGIMVLQGTATLKAGKLDLHGGIPLYLYYGGTLDFAGAEVSATTNAQCALYVDPDTENGVNSYKITGGTVELKSGKAAASALYTAIPENYGLWAGKDAESAKYIANPTQETLLTNPYARFGKVESYTLTLVNVKEGTSASHNGGEPISYTAKDAPADQHFSHWELTLAGATTKVGTDPVYSGTMPFGNATLTAVYENCTGGTATCTARAICQVCGKAYGGLGSHSYTAEAPEEAYLKSEATCTEAAVYYKSCAGCGESSRGTEFEAVFTYGSPLDHDWGKWTSNHDGTHTHICSRNPEHKETKDCQGGTADCTHGPICELCGEEYGQPGSHSYTAETPEETYLKSEATCTEAAVYYKSCVGCGASSRGTGHEVVFSHGNPLGHDEVTDAKVDPTCTATGLTEGKHCRRCGETLTEQREIPALGHEIPNGTVTKEPTCLEEGEKVGTCVRCGEANVTAPIAKSDHKEVVTPPVTATCSANGWTEGKRCSVCGTYTAERKLLNRLAHSIVVDAQTDSLTEGTHCSVCGTVLIPQYKKLKDYWTDEGNYDAELYNSQPGNWVIQDAADLAAFAKKLEDGEKFNRCTITLGADIDLSAHLWKPMQWEMTYKTSVFDGQLHKITGLRAVGNERGGLFGTLKYVELRNLTVCGDVTVTYTADAFRASVGGLIGEGHHNTLHNCGFIGTVQCYQLEESVSKEPKLCVGGLVGFAYGSQTIDNCFAIASLRTLATANTCFGFTGGLFGAAVADLTYHTYVNNCYAVAQLSSTHVNNRQNQIATIAGRTYGFLHFNNIFALATDVDAQISYGNVDRYLGTLMTEEQMKSQEGLVKQLNAYVEENSKSNYAWILNPKENSGYPSYGVALIAQIKQDPQFRQMQALAYGQKPNVPDYDVPFGYELTWYAEVNCTTPFDFNQPLYQNTTIYGKLEQITYPITYVLNGGQNAESNPAEYVMGVGTALADPLRENYLFEGWFTDAAFSSPITAISPQATGAFTLYAKWALDPNHPHQFGPCLLGADGKHDRFCSICEQTMDCEYTEVVTEPTCTSAGYTTHTCTACGLSHVDTIVEGGHIWNQAVTNPTHTEMGYTTYTCRRCKETYQANYTAPLGHSFDDGVITKEATCTEEGTMTYTCSCGETHTASIPKTDHDFEAVVTPSTCTEMGYTTYTCRHCGEAYKGDYTNPLGHTFDEGVVTEQPTCTKDGVKTYTCLCGETRTEAISMIGHDYEKTVTAPTCTEMGFTTYVCKNCGHTYKDSYLAAAGHKWDEGKVTSAPTITDTGRLVQTCVLCGKTKESTIPMLTACDGGSGCPAAAYTDVPGAAHWAHVGIDFVLKSGLFYGTSDREFHPNGEMNRAMLVTVLYRLEGKPAVSAASPFADVENGLWYSNAVIWAAENQIVNGIGNGLFNPEGKITREQLATILYRYSEYKGLTLGEGTFAEEYSDLEEISAYARKAMAWANAEGLINGVEESGTVTLRPQGNATRAQVAVILMRYVENILNPNK